MTGTTSAHHHEPAPSSSLLNDEAGATISCLICRAVYAPSATHINLIGGGPAVIESAFMSICHFCFRCRRPSCPSCWDDVHGVCGVCALETQLPFRSSTTPLYGLLFAPIRRAQAIRLRPLSPPLVCIQPGLLQRAPLPIDRATTVSIQKVPTPRISRKLSRRLQAQKATIPLQPRPLPPRVPLTPIIEENWERTEIAEVTTRPERVNSGLRQLERLVSFVVLAILIVVIVLIAVALLSASANTLIEHILHVDIRAEVAYLLKLLRSLHF